MSFTKSDFAKLDSVSRETLGMFSQWEELLLRWNPRINLVAASTLKDFWTRHALDSWQLVEHMPETTSSVIDLGSGAGFPGLALAIGLKGKVGASVTLVESVGKKANFMRTVIRELDLPAKVINERVESMPPSSFDLISARAFAPLDKLFNYSNGFWNKNTVALFPKGRGFEKEITLAQARWGFDYAAIPSKTDLEAVILKISNLQLKKPSTK